jgi:hypothetical protein
MKKKEKAFCVFISQGKSVEEASVMAGFRKGAQGMLLLARPDIGKEILRLMGERKSLYKAIALAGYERLAFGDVSDAVALLGQDSITEENLLGKDLFMVSEIKKPKDGALEIKFFDRYKALERLIQQDDDEKRSLPFYEALESGAKALGDVYE